jgi:hypothetical protein
MRSRPCRSFPGQVDSSRPRAHPILECRERPLLARSAKLECLVSPEYCVAGSAISRSLFEIALIGSFNASRAAFGNLVMVAAAGEKVELSDRELLQRARRLRDETGLQSRHDGEDVARRASRAGGSSLGYSQTIVAATDVAMTLQKRQRGTLAGHMGAFPRSNTPPIHVHGAMSRRLSGECGQRRQRTSSTTSSAPEARSRELHSVTALEARASPDFCATKASDYTCRDPNRMP